MKVTSAAKAPVKEKLKDVLKMEWSARSDWVKSLKLGPIVQRRVFEGLATLNQKYNLKDPYKATLEKLFDKKQVEDAIKANEKIKSKAEGMVDSILNFVSEVKARYTVKADAPEIKSKVTSAAKKFDATDTKKKSSKK